MLFIISYDSLCLFAFLILPRLKRGLGPLSFGPASPWGLLGHRLASGPSPHQFGGFCMGFQRGPATGIFRDAVRAAVDLYPNYSAVYDHQ